MANPVRDGASLGGGLSHKSITSAVRWLGGENANSDFESGPRSSFRHAGSAFAREFCCSNTKAEPGSPRSTAVALTPTHDSCAKRCVKQQQHRIRKALACTQNLHTRRLVRAVPIHMRKGAPAMLYCKVRPLRLASTKICVLAKTKQTRVHKVCSDHRMWGHHGGSRPDSQNGRPGQRGQTRCPIHRRTHPEPDNTACVRFTKVEALDRTITGARTLFGRTAAVRGSPVAAHPPERAGMSRASGELLNWRAFSQECDKGLIKTKRGRFL